MNRLIELILDDSGKLSFSRVAIAVIIAAYLCYGAWFLIAKGQMPDIPVGVVGLISLLYASNKFSPTVPFKGSPEA